MTATMEMDLKEENKANHENVAAKEPANARNNETQWLKKYRRPDWQKRSPIMDVFYRYGGYYS